MEEGCQEGWGGGRRGEAGAGWGTRRVSGSFPFLCRDTPSLHHLHPRPNKWQELRPAVFPFFNCLLFSMHPPPPPPPSPALPTPLAFIPLPSSSSVHPSLSLPGACLSGSVPVCLFADDSTWSRCDAQQLLLCSITLPCHLPRSALAASLPLSASHQINVSVMHLSMCRFFTVFFVLFF